MKIQQAIDEIEDYVAGNIEEVETIDRMSFSAYLRSVLSQYGYEEYIRGYQDGIKDEREYGNH